MRLLTSAAAIAAALFLPVAAQAAEAPVQVTLDASKPGAVIDRNIFGQFAEHLGSGIYGGIWVGKDSTIPNTRGIRNDVVAALKALKVPNVRWPGGCFADQYNWRRGVGPERKPAVGEPNSFGTDEFMDFAQQIGTEAYVSVNLGSGTVQEAAEWLLDRHPGTLSGGQLRRLAIVCRGRPGRRSRRPRCGGS